MTRSMLLYDITGTQMTPQRATLTKMTHLTSGLMMSVCPAPRMQPDGGPGPYVMFQIHVALSASGQSDDINELSRY